MSKACFNRCMTTISKTTNIRDRGYAVQRKLGHGTDEASAYVAGSYAIVLDDCYWGRLIHQGDEVQIRSLTNAGFRGIEAVCTHEDGELLVINLGYLEVEGVDVPWIDA